MSLWPTERVGYEEGVHSGDARTNKYGTEGRKDVLGHGPEVRKGKADGRERGMASPIWSALNSSRYTRDLRVSPGLHE